MISDQQPPKNTPSSQKNSYNNIWYDFQINKYYLHLKDDPKIKEVYQTGEYLKKFSVNFSGFANHKQRQERSKIEPEHTPYKPKCLKYNKNTTFYTPQMDKFEGYSQFQQPRTQPYFNQEKELQQNPKKKQEIEQQAVEIKKVLKNDMNQTLFNYKNLNKSNLGVSFITGTLNDYQNMKEKGKIKKLVQRQMKAVEIPVKMDNKLQQIEVVKVINERQLSKPNIHQLNQHKNSEQEATNNFQYSPQKSVSKRCKKLQLNDSSNYSLQKVNMLDEINSSIEQEPTVVVGASASLAKPKNYFLQSDNNTSFNSFLSTKDTRLFPCQNSFINGNKETDNVKINQIRYKNKIKSSQNNQKSFYSQNKNQEDMQTSFFLNADPQSDLSLTINNKNTRNYSSKTFKRTNFMDQTMIGLNQINSSNINKLLENLLHDYTKMEKFYPQTDKQKLKTKGRFGYSVIPSFAEIYAKDKNIYMLNSQCFTPNRSKTAFVRKQGKSTKKQQVSDRLSTTIDQ